MTDGRGVLAAALGATLVLVSLFSVRVRGQAVAEGYALARLAVEQASLERRILDLELRLAEDYERLSRPEAGEADS